MNYEMIKQLAKEMGCKVTDLIRWLRKMTPSIRARPRIGRLLSGLPNSGSSLAIGTKCISVVCITRLSASGPLC